MEKKLIDLNKLESVLNIEESTEVCGNCILNSACYGDNFDILSNEDKDLIEKHFDKCIEEGGHYTLKEGEIVEENEIV